MSFRSLEELAEAMLTIARLLENEGEAFAVPTGRGSGKGCAEAELQLRSMVLGSVTSPHTRRNYSKALDLLFALAAGRPLTRALLLEYRSSMEGLAPSIVNVRPAAVRKLVE